VLDRYGPTTFGMANWATDDTTMDEAFLTSRCDEAIAIEWTLTTAPGATS
jgi:hypothetical protein